MRRSVSILFIIMALLVACGGGENKSPRELCLETEEAITADAKLCDPQHGSIKLSCNNFGTGSSCDMLDDYFACLAQITCDNGSVVRATGCVLGICE